MEEKDVAGLAPIMEKQLELEEEVSAPPAPPPPQPSLQPPQPLQPSLEAPPQSQLQPSLQVGNIHLQPDQYPHPTLKEKEEAAQETKRMWVQQSDSLRAASAAAPFAANDETTPPMVKDDNDTQEKAKHDPFGIKEGLGKCMCFVWD